MAVDGWTHTGVAQQIRFGTGVIDELPEVVRSLGVRRLLLLTTEGRVSSDDGARVVGRLGRSLVSQFTSVRSHLPADVVQAAMLQARRDAVDAVVTFGGGSCIDLGKAINFFMEQEQGTPGASFVDRPAMPHIAIPTTYSGAEMTSFFGMTDPHTRTKSGGGGPTCTPAVVMHDPALTASTPPRVSAETAMNALAHCVEAMYSPRRTPEADAVAEAGAARVVAAAPAVVARPGDDAARAMLLEGAGLAGRALQNAAMGIHHGVSQLLGGRTGISHGLANALVLPHAIRFNADVIPDELTRIAAVFADGDDVAAAVERFRDGLGLPSHLSECGVTDEDIDAIARLSQGNVSVRRNVRPAGEADVRAILTAAW
jgi:maleylacetate reductase